MTKIDDSKLQMLGKVRRIVTHGGLPHMDDIMACAIAYALGVPHDAVIERRNPKPGELESMTVLVLDVGGVHDPEHLDFDHHQRSREEEPKCAFKLFSEWLGVDEELCRFFKGGFYERARALVSALQEPARRAWDARSS